MKEKIAFAILVAFQTGCIINTEKITSRSDIDVAAHSTKITSLWPLRLIQTYSYQTTNNSSSINISPGRELMQLKESSIDLSISLDKYSTQNSCIAEKLLSKKMQKFSYDIWKKTLKSVERLTESNEKVSLKLYLSTLKSFEHSDYSLFLIKPSISYADYIGEDCSESELKRQMIYIAGHIAHELTHVVMFSSGKNEPEIAREKQAYRIQNCLYITLSDESVFSLPHFITQKRNLHELVDGINQEWGRGEALDTAVLANALVLFDIYQLTKQKKIYGNNLSKELKEYCGIYQ